jgi:N-methylhydantoinase A
MERAIRVVSVERGHDPRAFTLLAFGGAGGLHATDLARALGMTRVYVPPDPGLLSAWGVLAADVVRDYGRTLRLVAPEERVLTAALRTLTDGARRDLGRERARIETFLDVRYVGQSYELRVPYGPGWRGAFDRLHARRFGHAHPARPVEVVTLRLRARVTGAPPPPAARARRGSGRPVARRTVVFDRKPRPAAVWRRVDLRPGRELRGPAVVCEYSATTVVPPDWRLHVDRVGGLVLETA